MKQRWLSKKIQKRLIKGKIESRQASGFCSDLLMNLSTQRSRHSFFNNTIKFWLITLTHSFIYLQTSKIWSQKKWMQIFGDYCACVCGEQKRWLQNYSVLEAFLNQAKKTLKFTFGGRALQSKCIQINGTKLNRSLLES